MNRIMWHISAEAAVPRVQNVRFTRLIAYRLVGSENEVPTSQRRSSSQIIRACKEIDEKLKSRARPTSPAAVNLGGGKETGRKAVPPRVRPRLAQARESKLDAHRNQCILNNQIRKITSSCFGDKRGRTWRKYQDIIAKAIALTRKRM